MAGLAQPVLPMIEYFVFKENIIEFLCEQRDVPDSDCEGMCYLKSQIEDQQNDEQQHLLLKIDELLTLHLPASLNSFELYADAVSELPAHKKSAFRGISFEIFHPPKS